MPIERLRFDLELLILVAGALAASLILTDKIFTDVATSALLIILFAIIGLNTDWREIRNHLHKRKEIAVSLISIFVLAPLASLPFYFYLPGEIGKAVFIVGISASSVGASVIWTNRAKGDGSTALMASGISLLLAFIFIPIWLSGFDSAGGSSEFLLRNLWIVFGPLALGSLLRKIPVKSLEDMKENFSAAGFTLIVFIMMFQMIDLSSTGLIGFKELVTSIAVLSIYVVITFSLGYCFSKISGLEEKQSRAIGFVTGDKAFALALFISIQFNHLVVQYIIIYFFVSRILMSSLSQYIRAGGLNETLTNINSEVRQEIFR